jgi:hypothetical protein
LFDKGVFIEDSFNNPESIFRALKGEAGQLRALVKVDKRVRQEA